MSKIYDKLSLLKIILILKNMKYINWLIGILVIGTIGYLGVTSYKQDKDLQEQGATIVENIKEIKEFADIENNLTQNLLVRNIDGNLTLEADENISEIVEIDTENTFFEFIGFAIGKEHVGTFDNWDLQLNIPGQNSILSSGKMIIQSNSVNTGIAALDKHLISEDFFAAEEFPTIDIEFSEIEDGNILRPNVTFRGVTKNVEVPLDITDTGAAFDIFLDLADFGFEFEHAQSKVQIKGGLSWKIK